MKESDELDDVPFYGREVHVVPVDPDKQAALFSDSELGPKRRMAAGTKLRVTFEAVLPFEGDGAAARSWVAAKLSTSFADVSANALDITVIGHE